MRVPKWAKWFGGGIIFVLVAIVGGTFVYIHFIEDPAPPKLTFENVDKATSTTTGGASTTGGAPSTGGSETTPATAGVDGEWKATDASIFGYRVKEELFGQNAEAYGRTQKVTGSMTISGTQATKGALTVDMTSVASDQSRRDDQFRGRIMATSEFPTAKFVLTKPAAFGTVPADKTQVNVELTGDLTLRGNTKSVTVQTQARRNGANIEVTGSIPIVFDDWGIPNPSGGPASTADNGILEFFVVFAPA